MKRTILPTIIAVLLLALTGCTQTSHTSAATPTTQTQSNTPASPYPSEPGRDDAVQIIVSKLNESTGDITSITISYNGRVIIKNNEVTQGLQLNESNLTKLNALINNTPLINDVPRTSKTSNEVIDIIYNGQQIELDSANIPPEFTPLINETLSYLIDPALTPLK